MKKMIKLLPALLLLLLVGAIACADGGAATSASDVLPELVVKFLQFLQGVPKIGPFVAFCLKAIGIGSAILTPLTALLIACSKAFGNVPKLDKLCDFLNAWVLPFCRKFSNFNEAPKLHASDNAGAQPTEPALKV